MGHCGRPWTSLSTVCITLSLAVVDRRPFHLTAVLVSRSLLLTARLEEGSLAQIDSLHGKPGSGVAKWLPSLQCTREARFVRLKEFRQTTSVKEHTSTSFTHRENEQRRDWLALLLREHLGKCTFTPRRFTHISPSVGLKFILVSQILEVRYENKFRRFQVESLSEKVHEAGVTTDSISDDIASLSIDPSILWKTGWDMFVHIYDNDSKDEHPSTQLVCLIHALRTAYTQLVSLG